MIVIDETWRPQAPEHRQGTLVHEMVHTALNPETSARTPPWLIEGVAMYVEGDDQRQASASGLAPDIRLSAISRPNSIFRLRGERQSAAYVAASAAAYAIVDRHGNEGLFRLYDAFNDPNIPGRPGAKTTDRVMRRTLKMSLAELQSAIG
jgi:hypothetical protein